MAVPFAVLSYGENHYNVTNNRNTISTTTHAEENAIRKLPPLPRHKKVKKVDILVIRANKTTLGSSKPCVHCLLKMKSLPAKGYSIESVFFSTSDGIIEECKLDDLLHSNDPHVSSYYRGTGFVVSSKLSAQHKVNAK